MKKIDYYEFKFKIKKIKKQQKVIYSSYSLEEAEDIFKKNNPDAKLISIRCFNPYVK